MGLKRSRILLFYLKDINSILLTMQHNNQINQSAIPPQQQSIGTFPNQPSIQSATPYNPHKFAASVAEGKVYSSKPKGMMITQAVEIKRLNQTLNDYKQQVYNLERHRIDKQNYEAYIKDLTESDSTKKNQIEKLSLTIRSLIASCETYRRQVGSSTDKTKQLQEANRDFHVKNQYLTTVCQKLKTQNQTVKKQTQLELNNMNKQLNLNSSYVESLKVNNQDLMQRVKMIPEYQKQIFDQQSQITFWKEDSEKRSYQLGTMNDLFRSTEAELANLSKKYKNIEQTHSHCQNQYAKLRNQLNEVKQRLADSQVKNGFLIQKTNDLEISLNTQPPDQTYQLENKLNQTKKQLNIKSKALVDLEKQIQFLAKNSSQQQEEVKKKLEIEKSKFKTEKQNQIKGLKVLIQQLKHQHIFTKFLLQKREKENQELMMKLKMFQEQNVKLEQKLSNCEAEKTVTLVELKKYREKDRSKQLEDQLKIVTTNLRETTNEVNNKVNKIKQLEEKLKSDKINNAGKLKEVDSLKAKLVASSKKIQILEDEMKKTTKSADILKNYFNEATEHNAALKDKIDSLEEDMKEIDRVKEAMRQSELKLKEQHFQNVNKIALTHQNEKRQLEGQRQTLQNFVETHLMTQFKLQKLIKKGENSSEVKLNSAPSAVKEITLESQNQTSNQLVDSIEQGLNRYQQLKRNHKRLEEVTIMMEKDNRQLAQKEDIKRKQCEVLNNSIVQLSKQNKNKLTELQDLSNLYERKTAQNETLKIKLYELEEQLRTEYDAVFKSEIDSLQENIEKIKKEREQAGSKYEQILKERKQLEEQSQVYRKASANSFMVLSEKLQNLEKINQKCQQQNENMRNDAQKQKISQQKYQQTITKLAEELQRLQGLLASTSQQQKQQQAQQKAKLTQLEVYLNMSKEKVRKNEEHYEKKIKTDRLILEKQISNYEQALNQLQSEFISLQLLIAELKQQRNVLLKKNAALVKGIQMSHDQLEKLNENAEKTSKYYDQQSSVHGDLQHHYDTINHTFSSLQKFKIVEEKILQKFENGSQGVPL